MSTPTTQLPESRSLAQKLKPLALWILLFAITAYLLTWVDPSAVESPYNGF
jgi:hypothetical protein